MHKVLISFTVLASATLAGCGSMSNVSDPIADALDDWSLMYRPNVQQGNVITQEMMDRVRLGMDKRQVRYALGTPMLVDVFHQERWDYVYTFGRGSKPREFARSAMIFEDGRLVSIEGELQPRPPSERPEVNKEVLVEVPDYEAVDAPLFDRALSKVGLKDLEE